MKESGVRGGNPIGFVSITKDITECKRAEDMLHKSEKRFRDFFENSAVGFHIFGPDRIIADINETELAMIGYTRDEIAGKKTWIDLIVPEQRDQFEKHWQDIITKGEVRDLEYTLVHKDGHHIDVILNASSKFDEHDNLINTRGSVLNITARKRLEKRLIKAERLAAIGELATMVGHDLRNPLQAIENATYYLNNELPHLSIPQKAAEMLQIINDSVNYADKIIKNLQDFSATKKPILKKTNINAIVKDALSQVETPENVELITELDHFPEIKADKDMIKRVFLNLALNGIQAMENGGRLKVSTKKTKDFVEVSFKDTGIGMSKESMKNLFTPFFTTKAKGMGMGLAICKRFVDAHDGSIEVESVEGKGSTFTVKLSIPQRQMEVKTIGKE